jgi:hypothetical protein
VVEVIMRMRQKKWQEEDSTIGRQGTGKLSKLNKYMEKSGITAANRRSLVQDRRRWQQEQ